MIIWIFNHYATHPQSPGGSRHYHLSRYLVQQGHEVTIFASSFHYNTYQETQTYPVGESVKEEWVDGIRYVWIKSWPYQRNNWKRYLNILDYTRQILIQDFQHLKAPDVVVGSSFHLFAAWAASKISKRYKAPFVAEIRDLWPETLIALGKSKYHPLVLLLRLIEKRIYEEASAIIVLFAKAPEYIKSIAKQLPPAGIHVVPNGVDCEEIRPNFNQGANNQEGQMLFKVLYAGSLGNVYCLESLVEAMRLIQEKNLNIILELMGSGVLETALRKQVQQKRISNIRFKAPVNKTAINEAYASADVLYASLMNSPLYKWGMSLNKIHEYMAAGKPIVLGYNQKENPVSQYQCGIVVAPDQPIAIADAIIEMYQMSKDERDVMGKLGRNAAVNEFDFNRLGKKMELILQSTLERKK